MSNKAGVTTMKQAIKREMTPKLRFPEFRDAGEWDADVLGEVAEFVNEKIALERIALENYVSTENILPDYGGVARASKLPAMGSVTQFRPNDTLVSNIRPYLKKVWVADKEGGASNDVIVIRAKQRLLPQYISFLLKNDAFINYVMTGAKGVKMPRGDIGSIKEYPALYPAKAEQQKIADFLFSIDELITAQTQKLATLKTHKKGLMQQLFPAEGETLPKLRFPEFRDAGEWEEKALDKCLDYQQPTAYLVSDTQYSDAYKTPVLTAGKTFILGYTNEQHGIFSDNLPVIIFDDFTTATQFVDFPFKAKSSAMKILQAKNGANIKFMYEIMQMISYEVGVHERHWISKFAPMSILVPHPSEQQKIADFLFSIDELITAQTQKLTTLKTHKKGLMQALFPTADEVTA